MDRASRSSRVTRSTSLGPRTAIAFASAFLSVTAPADHLCEHSFCACSCERGLLRVKRLSVSADACVANDHFTPPF